MPFGKELGRFGFKKAFGKDMAVAEAAGQDIGGLAESLAIAGVDISPEDMREALPTRMAQRRRGFEARAMAETEALRMGGVASGKQIIDIASRMNPVAFGMSIA